ncbi:MAG TPA: chromate efflux transporter [Rhodocyclaceae bacterium]|nr:chromate efflux transporter [Rhodocyclaceae bacterium]
MNSPDHRSHATEGVFTLFLIFLRLGLTSFGGPIAHLGYFREEFVRRRRWLSERSYADLVALCQFLPGPASSQVGLAVGLSRHGYLGALAAWAGFTLPSALALALFAIGITQHAALLPPAALHGLKVVAVAVVAQAVWGMARNLCQGVGRISIMVAASCVALLLPTASGQVGVIAVAALLGVLFLKPHQDTDLDALPIRVRRGVGLLWLALFGVLLIGLPLLAHGSANPALAYVDAFFRAGALVFGGGHVVLPLLQTAVVAPGWVDNDIFLAGYGAAQAVPGPLFTFAAFLGAAMHSTPTGWSGALICLLAIFAPSFLLIVGALPFWEDIRHDTRARAALAGVNAAVVGVLLAALYQPVWTSAIQQPRDFGLALLGLVALMFWKLPPWLVVLASGLLGYLMTGLG